jgi:hypothetical protein
MRTTKLWYGLKLENEPVNNFRLARILAQDLARFKFTALVYLGVTLFADLKPFDHAKIAVL